ncbi:hypothetical protein K439DRAFT_1528326 [Ramaria rubella]|nr:hypothetical protein K439DRAFT_1528326 [Ramaria rubella]
MTVNGYRVPPANKNKNKARASQSQVQVQSRGGSNKARRSKLEARRSKLEARSSKLEAERPGDDQQNGKDDNGTERGGVTSITRMKTRTGTGCLSDAERNAKLGGGRWEGRVGKVGSQLGELGRTAVHDGVGTVRRERERERERERDPGTMNEWMDGWMGDMI